MVSPRRASRLQPLVLVLVLDPFFEPSMRPAESLKSWLTSLPDPQADPTAALARQTLGTAASKVSLPTVGIALDFPGGPGHPPAFLARPDISLKSS